MGSKPRPPNRRRSHRATRTYPWPLVAALALVVLFHLSVLLFGSFRNTYDAYVHLFFADHYQRGWFTTWEPRWYTGFTTVSYPPGTHQLLASIGALTGLLSGFIIVSTAAIGGIVIGTFRSAQIWVDRESAAYAALLAALSSSITESLHVFGQLPTLVSLAFALNGLPHVYRWMSFGGRNDLWAAWAFAAATTAVHHVTTLFGVVFIISPVVVRPILDAFKKPLPGEPANAQFTLRAPLASICLRARRLAGPTTRAAIYLGGVVSILVTVVLPYWLYSSRDPISQIPIPHGSRANFIAQPSLGLVFFVIPWGLLAVAMPFAMVRGFSTRAWPLAASVALLALLGTGGTTPIPRLLLGPAFDILTLDRFTFWATVLVLPLAGRFVRSARRGGVRRLLNINIGSRTTTALSIGTATAFVGFTIFTASFSQFRPLQPDPIDMDPIVSFLRQDRHDQWRYLTLGFGDQMAWLSANTGAETVDGNYHAARRLPELNSRPVERLEGAKYTGVAGLGSLQQFLTNPERFHLKFVFSNDKFYDPLLWASGWQQLEPLENSIRVWQRDDVTPLPTNRAATELAPWQRAMWGTLPPLSMVAGLAAIPLAALGRRRTTPPGPCRVWAPIDRWLMRRSARLGAARWASTTNRRQRLRRKGLRPLRRTATRRRRTVQRVMLFAALGVAGAAFVTVALPRGGPSPAEVVYDYYDALDLRRVDDAFGLIDPRSVASKDQYLTEYRMNSGLVSSFARLESMTTPEVTVDADRAWVRTNLSFFTPLQRFEVPVSERLRRIDGRWRLVYRPVSFTIPPESFAATPAVDYLSQGRRQPIYGATANQDVLDRPRILASKVRLVEVGDSLSVVGEVTNIDAVPAYLTVSATLRDAAGNRLIDGWNGNGTMYTVLPQETVPYRIDFEQIAGLRGWEDMQFEPGQRRTSSIDPATVTDVDVAVQTLVTTANLGRHAQLLGVQRSANAINAHLFNAGSTEITIAEFFVTLRHNGSPMWIVNAFSPEAVGPRRSKPQRIALPSPDRVRPHAVTAHVIVNDIPHDDYTTDAEPAEDWNAFDVAAMSFLRSVG